ncbi:NaCP60E [Symbiodinium necroappetens]|uniref:NaCP60E protein n=1 Tax=Symbiodinium necroappetens TaxID=1628268 RepID=A0A813C6G9_9DINO|nr:NaCP60E [Symbiodinium necroappetens]
MWSLSMYDVEHPSFALKAAVAANVLAPPSLTLEQVRELQEAEIVEYSKPDFQTLIRLAGALACGTLECFALKERAVHCSRNDPGEESSCAATALSPGAGADCGQTRL